MGFSGGAPATISAAGRDLVTSAGDVTPRATGVRQAGRGGVPGAGGSVVAAALERFVAAYATFADGVGTELDALGTMADHTGQDIAAAGCAPGAVR